MPLDSDHGAARTGTLGPCCRSDIAESRDLVTTARFLADDGVTRRQRAAEVESGRWRRVGLAIVMHNGPLSPAQRRRVARIHAGPRSLLTAFTVAEICGLRGPGARTGGRPGMCRDPPPSWSARCRCGSTSTVFTRRRAWCPAVVLEPCPTRWSVPQRHSAATPSGVRVARRGGAAAADDDGGARRGTHRHSRTRHRRALTLAIADIEGGSQALSEIDFVRLCRRHRLPQPLQQRLRREPGGSASLPGRKLAAQRRPPCGG